MHLARRNASLIGVMFIDFDSFKSVNDLAGHATGDQVLRQAAQLLSACLRRRGYCSAIWETSFNQDFQYRKVEDLYKASHRIQDVLKEPITVQDVEYFVSASIGVAVYPIDGRIGDLNQERRYRNVFSKSKGKNQCVYCMRDQRDIIKKLKLTNSLYRALDKNGSAAMQPLVKVETQEICGFEALCAGTMKNTG